MSSRPTTPPQAPKLRTISLPDTSSSTAPSSTPPPPSLLSIDKRNTTSSSATMASSEPQAASTPPESSKEQQQDQQQQHIQQSTTASSGITTGTKRRHSNAGSSPIVDPIDTENSELLAMSGASLLLSPRRPSPTKSVFGIQTRRPAAHEGIEEQDEPVESGVTASSIGCLSGTSRARKSSHDPEVPVAGSAAASYRLATAARSDDVNTSRATTAGDDSSLLDLTIDTSQGASVDTPDTSASLHSSRSPVRQQKPPTSQDTDTPSRRTVAPPQHGKVPSAPTSPPLPAVTTSRKGSAVSTIAARRMGRGLSMSSMTGRDTVEPTNVEAAREAPLPKSGQDEPMTARHGPRSHTATGVPAHSQAQSDASLAQEAALEDKQKLMKELQDRDSLAAALTQRVSSLEDELAAMRLALERSQAQPAPPPVSHGTPGLEVPHEPMRPLSAESLRSARTPDPFSPFQPLYPYGHTPPGLGGPFGGLLPSNLPFPPSPYLPSGPATPGLQPPLDYPLGLAEANIELQQQLMQQQQSQQQQQHGQALPPRPIAGLSGTTFMRFDGAQLHVGGESATGEGVGAGTRTPDKKNTNTSSGLASSGGLGMPLAAPAPRMPPGLFGPSPGVIGRGHYNPFANLPPVTAPPLGGGVSGPPANLPSGLVASACDSPPRESTLDFHLQGPSTPSSLTFGSPGTSLSSFRTTRSPGPSAFMSGLGPSSSTPPSRGMFSDSSYSAAAASRRDGKAAQQSASAASDVAPEALVARALSGRGQDAGIALQQQLKNGSSERKAAILRALEPHVKALAEDKHGNFLVQRAIGVDSRIAWKLKGSFVELSLSQFGCHVVQKVLDEDERLKVTVVEELLSDRVAETLTSRNSIHVWQKVLEINWAVPKFRATVFEVINVTMRGRWAETARQETGSIICQNIFESADAQDKQGCIEEILERVCECAANQWGVWVVQHIIEHGEEVHRKVVFDKLLTEAIPLTLSQYGQKAIMSALKSGDLEFLASYVDILCDRESGSTSSSATGSGGSSSRRSVLVDVASVPQGLQIVATLLTSVNAEQRERIIRTVRKNSVFLKGSKAGLKVHQLCERARAFTGY